MRLRMQLVAAGFAVLLAASLTAQESVSVGGQARWHKVTGGDQVIRSVRTGQPMGTLPDGTQFLAFGTTDQAITLAFQGQVGFIPRSAASLVNPTEERSVQWRGTGPTLEDIVEERRAQNEADRRSGKPLYKPKATGTPGPGGVPAPGGAPAGLAPGEGIDPYGASRGAGGGYV